MVEISTHNPISSLINNPNVNEIWINDYDKIYFENDGINFKLDDAFASKQAYSNFIQQIIYDLRKSADERHPLLEGTLANGIRVQITLPPISPTSLVTLRKHRTQDWTLNEMQKCEFLTQEHCNMLSSWINQNKNILVCGPTGSGKTTLLRGLLNEVHHNQRIVIIEDTPEIKINHENTVYLTTRSDPEGLVPHISLEHLVRASLRMCPNRIVMGEVRGPEATALIDALSTGHKGSMCTMHAGSAQECLKRLVSLVARGAPTLNIMSIRQMIADAIDCILVLEIKNGRRFLSSAAELSSVEEFGFLLTPRA